MRENGEFYLEGELQHFFNNTNDLCCVANQQGFFEIFNPRFEEILGYSAKELLQTPFLDYVHPDDVEATVQEMHKLGHGATTINFINRYRKKDGDYVWLEWNATPDTEKGKIYAIARNVTARKKAEERFRLLVESSPYAIVLVNQLGEIMLVNAETEHLFGYTRTELMGKSVEILIPAEFTHSHVHHRTEFFKNPTTRAMGTGRDLYALRKNGEKFPVEIGLNPMDTTEGKFIIASIVDISYRKEQEKALMNKQNELETKNKELEQFAYIASHDMQEPLRTVSNYLQLLKKKNLIQDGEDSSVFVEAMEGALGRMKILIKQLLDYSRLGRNRKLQLVDTSTLVSNVISDLETVIHDSGANIIFQKLPTVVGYEVELGQLFQNLISNAIKFRKKEVMPEVIIAAQEKNAEWLFSVTDNGIGIDPKYFDKIFRIFQRLHSIDEYEGSGIGLANCKKIVELHKGSIWVESAPDKGTVVYFTIPKYHL